MSLGKEIFNRLFSRLGVIFLVSVVLRISATLFLGEQLASLPGTADQVSYNTLALRLLEDHGFTFGKAWWPATAAGAPTAHWSYLYTMFLARIYALFGANPLIARLIQAVIVGILHPYLVYQIGRHIFNEKVGLFSAALTAIYAYFIYYAASLMTEAFYITAVLASLYLAIILSERLLSSEGHLSDSHKTKLAIGVGISLGTAVLLRQLFLLFIPFLFLWIWWSSRKQGFKAFVVAGAIILAFILPLTIYNHIRFDRFVLLNTNAGYAFFWANHPIYGTHFEPILPPEMGTYQDLIPVALRHLDEAALDQALLRRGIQFVIDDPGRYLMLSLSRIPTYFKFWPSSESSLVSNISRVASFGLLLPLMLYGLVRSVINRSSSQLYGNRSAIILLYLFIGIYTAIHLLSWALIRYRLPVDAVLVIFAGLGLADLASRFGIFQRPAIEQA
jgi:4-amino-4-deoxy-L-arabinose transferase-like glycosyltransferase